MEIPEPSHGFMMTCNSFNETRENGEAKGFFGSSYQSLENLEKSCYKEFLGYFKTFCWKNGNFVPFPTPHGCAI